MASKIQSSPESRLMKLSLEEKIGQLFFPAAFINDSDENIKLLEKLIQDFAIGGLTFFHSREMAATNYEKQKDIPKNDRSHQRLKELVDHYQSISKYPLLMSIDAEWGLAMRVENTVQYPYALTLGATSNPYLVYEVGEAVGKDLLETGIHLNLAPVFDINDNPANPVIGYRSFGEDKNKVADLATAFYRGMKSVGVLGCAKHFPGHGNTSIDSHRSLPVIDRSEDQLIDQELYPFIKAIENNIDLVMPGHLAIPALTGSDKRPTSLSKEVVTGLLRERLGFSGAIMTDALNMHAVSKMFKVPGQLELEAFNAGNDILSFSSNIPEAIEMISRKALPERVEESFDRLSVLKEKAGIMKIDGKEAQPISPPEVIALRERLASECLTEIQEGALLSNTGLDRMACLILNKSSEASSFVRYISSIKTMPIYDLPIFTKAASKGIENSLVQYDKIIIGLYIPNIKPPNRFGLDEQMTDWISGLCSSQAIQLVVFGNPYALEFINYRQTERTLLAYQDLPEFERKAAEAIFGLTDIKGALPITI